MLIDHTTGMGSDFEVSSTGTRRDGGGSGAMGARLDPPPTGTPGF